MVRMQWTISEFFADGGAISFANRLASVLGIHSSRIKVVGVSEGSVVVNYVIEPDPSTVASASATSGATTSTSSVNELQALTSKLQNSYSGGTLFLGAPILDFVVVVVASDGTVVDVQTVEEDKLPSAVLAMIILACVATIAAGAMIIVQKVLKARKERSTKIDTENGLFNRAKENFEPGKFSSEEEEKNPEPISVIEAVEETPLSHKGRDKSPTFHT